MFFKQTCICLTHSTQSEEKVGICESERTIDYHHGSALKLRNTCRHSQHNGWLVYLSQCFPY